MQKTTRPASIFPEEWWRLSPKEKAKQIRLWDIESAKRDEVRERRGISNVVSEEDTEEFEKVLSDAKRIYAMPNAPAMPVIVQAMISKQDSVSEGRPSASSNQQCSQHDDHVAEAGYVSEEAYAMMYQNVSEPSTPPDGYAMIHLPIPMPKALQIPEAVKALENEWAKLENPERPSWDIEGVRSKAEVAAEAKASGKTVHFGNLMPLCHRKNSEFGEEFWSYKGRIVFRGDGVKDEQGFFAVFTEQGTSSTQQAGTKFLDIIARFPGNKGEDSDARGAYTQFFTI
jgi:hypothetical protein